MDALMAIPGFGRYFRSMGVLPAAPDAIATALAEGHDVALWPGGEVDSLRPWSERLGLRMWSWLAGKPALYAFATRVGARVLAWMGGRERLIHKLPLGSGWTEGRDMPAPAGKTFRDLYAARVRGERS